ncbi:MAG: DUF6265 family protein [Proteobacteria bacterium]|nr:DUF6265 family protein [Pseudomonadota bacterium]
MHKSNALLFVACLLAGSAHAGDGTTVASLAWMSGTYSGPVGPGTLEENWIEPRDGAIASLVRMTGAGKTSMVELIVIEEEADTLVLRLQQWNPGFSPRTPGPQKMVLAEQGDQSVRFVATDEGGGMKSLGYSLVGDDFTISIENAEGQAFALPLKAQN